jgi:hypothetical protein
MLVERVVRALIADDLPRTNLITNGLLVIDLLEEKMVSYDFIPPNSFISGKVTPSIGSSAYF